MAQSNGTRPTGTGLAMLTVNGAALTDAGPVRLANQDSVAVVLPEDLRQLAERGVLTVVADGMGGHEGGEVASGIAAARVAEAYYAAPGSPQDALLKAFEVANREIYEMARTHPRLIGMGTTCTAVAVVNGLAYSAHVGDSRLYLIREGHIYQMTEDHSATMEMVRHGMLTLAEARSHDERNVILKAMGTRPELDTAHWSAPFPARENDRLLLCSDGLYERIEDHELADITSSRTPIDGCRELIRLAVERQSTDNVSAVVLEVSGAPVTKEVSL
jgi:serine/threonine protein phosphatase PrpC